MSKNQKLIQLISQKTKIVEVVVNGKTKNLRKQMTRVEIANEIGIFRQTFQNAIMNRNTTLKNAFKIAKYFNKKIDDIWSIEDFETNT